MPEHTLTERPSKGVMQENIIERYNQEAKGCCTSLSCGQPLIYLGAQTGETVLDIGFGLGMEMMKAANAVGETGKVFGIDISPEMMMAARETAIANGYRNCEFLLAEAEALPFDSDSMDGVISNCVINHSLDKNKVYAEIHRVLKPGGRFVISDIYAQKELPDHIKNDPEMWAQCIGGAITKEDYIKAVQNAGFKDIRIIKESVSPKKANYGIMNFTIFAVKESN